VYWWKLEVHGCSALLIFGPGGPTAAVMAFQNPSIRVTVVDKDAQRIAQFKTRHLPIYEPGLYEVLRVARDGTKSCKFYNEAHRAGSSLDGMSSNSSETSECESQCGAHREEIEVPARAPNLFFSTEVSKSISEADIVLICVNTPTKRRGIGKGKATDVTALEAVTREIAIHAKPGAIIVEKSTVPCKTAEIVQDTVCRLVVCFLEGIGRDVSNFVLATTA
jgi:UDPglucose 6-dehydrogenase